MKIIQINATCGTGSTGKICSVIAALLDQNHVENYIFYSSAKSSDPHGKKYISKWNAKLQAIYSRVIGNYGFNTFFATKRLLKELDKISPDIVHLHNLHGHNVNLTLLFRYFKKHPKIKIFWTFHDCWAFTAYCTHFTIEKCNQWVNGCHHCPQYRTYSWFFDRSHTLYNRKKELFTGLDMTVITPSKWLADIVADSFLGNKRIEVINNGIDLSVFKPRKSDFAKKYNIDSKKIVLGIPKSGLQCFTELHRLLPSQYHIVLVGLGENEINSLPQGMTGIPYTNSAEELAEIYSAADVFVNTTLADTFPTVNIESLACGTPIVTFKTGGSSEIIDEKTGIVTEQGDIHALGEAVKKICCGPDRSSDCISRAERLYNAKERFNDYIDLYNRTGRFK